MCVGGGVVLWCTLRAMFDLLLLPEVHHMCVLPDLPWLCVLVVCLCVAGSWTTVVGVWALVQGAHVGFRYNALRTLRFR